MKLSKPKTALLGYQQIDQYIATFAPEIQLLLQKIRRSIRDEVPEADQKISYGIPTFTLHGNLVHFAAFKKHIGFYPGARGISKFKRELLPYRFTKGSVQFPFDKPVPFALIVKIVRFRVKENLSKLHVKR